MTVLTSLSAECQLHRVVSSASPAGMEHHHHHLAAPADSRGHQDKKPHSACDSCGCCVGAFRLLSPNLTFAPAIVVARSDAPLPPAPSLGSVRSEHSFPFSTAPPASRVTLPV
ncbi:MAG TPA: hypothetical protein VGG76_13565 [Gemmatimonadaceae bacterium]